MKNRQLDTALGLEARNGPLALIGKLVLYGLLVLVFAGPLLALLVSAFSPVSDPTSLTLLPTDFTLANFRAAFDRDVLRYLLNSFLVVGGGLLLQVGVSISAGYALARKRFPGMRLVLLLILSTMMLPEEVLAIPLSLVLSDLSLTGSLWGMIVPVGAWAFSILVTAEFMKEIPLELEEAARLDGAGDLRIFWSVVLPLCKPALGVIGIFGFTMIWDQYMLPLLVATDARQFTLPLALRTLRADEQVGVGVLLASALLALLPSVLAFLAMQRQFMRGLTSGAVKG
ncbi:MULTISPECIES: carbohydrate ABC transporter permease [unclassified Kitasatospora]|uniref:carbohydrate ABC transporter permease n=1 Tax=unclassified Kitasatospora TaxID=2633591 RepID=UPI00070A8D1F|nr:MULTISPECIES: carbohydrate ABC transporter permease [unclassified Kitasatospora]KQV21849.1 sugar ABC transporter permease [Kitasatospora sp. Root107]KRB75358.1 sugar ABC transporter permease [Kitasatospora sp. Root187]